MRPQKFQLDIHSNSHQHHRNKTEEHEQHSLEGRLVEDIMVSALVYEIEHLVGCDIAVRVRNCPLVLLDVLFFLDLGYNCHLGPGHHQVGDRFESELQYPKLYHLENSIALTVECHNSKEHRILGRLSSSLLVVESGHILVLLLE